MRESVQNLKYIPVAGAAVVAVTLLISFLVRDSLAVGAATAVTGVILTYFVFGRFFNPLD